MYALLKDLIKYCIKKHKRNKKIRIKLPGTLKGILIHMIGAIYKKQNELIKKIYGNKVDNQ